MVTTVFTVLSMTNYRYLVSVILACLLSCETAATRVTMPPSEENSLYLNESLTIGFVSLCASFLFLIFLYVS